MNKEVIFSSKEVNWATPQDFFDKLNTEFQFTLDPCADINNHKCKKYYTEETDGLRQDWSNEIVFCNPPYGRVIGQWVKKCFDEVYSGECKCAVMLLPARTDTIIDLMYLIESTPDVSVEEGIFIADHLIANGVEIPVHCCDCAKCITHIDDVGCSYLFCKRQKGNPMVDPTDFCSYGERRNND